MPLNSFAENTAAAVEYLEGLGVEFTKLNFHGGHSVPRTNTKLEHLIEDENGVILKFDTLEELADHYEIAKDEFLAEVERWNGFVEAGEVAGGTHGAVRLGSCAITDCVVFGRIAGQRAAAEQPWE